MFHQCPMLCSTRSFPSSLEKSLLLCVLSFHMIFGHTVYTDQYVVQIPGGLDRARLTSERHGFIYLGHVSLCDRFWLRLWMAIWFFLMHTRRSLATIITCDTLEWPSVQLVRLMSFIIAIWQPNLKSGRCLNSDCCDEWSGTSFRSHHHCDHAMDLSSRALMTQNGPKCGTWWVRLSFTNSFRTHTHTLCKNIRCVWTFRPWPFHLCVPLGRSTGVSLVWVFFANKIMTNLTVHLTCWRVCVLHLVSPVLAASFQTTNQQIHCYDRVYRGSLTTATITSLTTCRTEKIVWSAVVSLTFLIFKWENGFAARPSDKTGRLSAECLRLFSFTFFTWLLEDRKPIWTTANDWIDCDWIFSTQCPNRAHLEENGGQSWCQTDERWPTGHRTSHGSGTTSFVKFYGEGKLRKSKLVYRID